MHVRTTAGVSFTTACTATPTRHAHRASVATYMQQHQHQQQQQAASSATCYGACQEDLSTCGFLHNMYCVYLPRSGLHQHQSALNLHTAAAALRASIGLKKVHVTNVTAPLPTYYLTPIFPSCSRTTTDEQMMAKMSWLACIHAVTPRR